MDPFNKPLSIILIPSKIIEDFPIFNITCNEIMTWFLDKREWTEVDQSVSIHSQLWSNIRICREVSCHHELTEHLQKLTNNIRKVFTGLVIERRDLRIWDVCCFQKNGFSATVWSNGLRQSYALDKILLHLCSSLQRLLLCFSWTLLFAIRCVLKRARLEVD